MHIPICMWTQSGGMIKVGLSTGTLRAVVATWGYGNAKGTSLGECQFLHPVLQGCTPSMSVNYHVYGRRGIVSPLSIFKKNKRRLIEMTFLCVCVSVSMSMYVFPL
jgi:hypothetical protein